MAYVTWEQAITWKCPECETRNFAEGEPYDLDDPTDFADFQTVCEFELNLFNSEQARISASWRPITFAQAEVRGFFDDMRRPPHVVACTKCKSEFDLMSEEDTEDDEAPLVGN